MSQLCDALSSVLDRCARLQRRRLAGYAANIDFWVGEVEHRLKLIDGYVNRRKKMVSGTRAVYEEDICRTAPASPAEAERLLSPNGADVSAEWEALAKQSRDLRKQVVKSLKRFLKRCLATKLIDTNKLFEIEDRLGLNLRGRS